MDVNIATSCGILCFPRTSLWAGIGLLWALPTAAFETVKILETTSTGRALILDRGIFEGIRPNDFALFYRKEERSGHLPRYLPLIKAEAIKVGDKISFWLAHETTSNGNLLNGDNLSMVRLSRHKQRHLQINQGQTITPKSSTVDIDKKDHQYSYEEVSAYFQENRKKDALLNHPGHWKESKDKNISQLSFDQILPPINKKNIAKSLEAEHFDQITNKTITKLNSSQDIEEYLSILKSPPQDYLKGRETRWSRYMNDQQIQDFFVKAGVVKEVYQRQKKALREWKGSEIHLRYSTGFHLPLLSNSDDTYKSSFALSAGYEYHLANIKPKLKKWSIEAGMGIHQSNLLINNYWLSSQEYIFQMWSYYYFHKTSLTIEQYVFYAGVGIQYGTASLSSSSLRNSYDYQISGTPSFRLGAKYKFEKNNFQLFGHNIGINFLLTASPLKYLNRRRGRTFKGGSVNKFSSTLSIGLSTYL